MNFVPTLGSKCMWFRCKGIVNQNHVVFGVWVSNNKSNKKRKINRELKNSLSLNAYQIILGLSYSKKMILIKIFHNIKSKEFLSLAKLS